MVSTRALTAQRGGRFGYWVALGGGSMFLALSLASYRARDDWRFWQLPHYWLDYTLTVGTFVACLVLYRVLVRSWRSRLQPPPVQYSVLRPLCLTLGFGVLLLVMDGAGLAAAPRFIATAYAVLVAAFALAPGQAARRPVRVGLVPSGRIAQLSALRQPGLEWVILNETQIPRGVHAVAADLHTRLTPEWTTFLADCQLRGLPVLHSGTVYERLTGRVSLRYLRACALQGVHPSRAQMVAKRAGELALIVLLSPFLLLVMASTALAIRLESRGSVFFWQERIGLNGRPFRMVKFRSMRVGADADGAAYAQRGDTRITRVGAFIRRTRIDELPQLYNVLRGDMSLIGPRPEQVPFARQFAEEIPFYSSRHHVRPGITGWAQVSSGYAADAEQTAEKLAYDLFYVRHLSFWLDAVIAWNTIRTVLTGAGAR